MSEYYMMFAHPPLGVFKCPQDELSIVVDYVKQLDYKIVFDDPNHTKISEMYIFLNQNL